MRGKTQPTYINIIDYLSKEVGVCISKDIVVHLLWADDLILFSDSVEGLQKQLDGLYKYSANNHMIVNETKKWCVLVNVQKLEWNAMVWSLGM